MTPLLQQLNWLKVEQRIDLSARCTRLPVSSRFDVTVRTLPTISSECVSDLDAWRRLRSASTCTLVITTTRLFTVGDRAFPVAATRTWNRLPDSVTKY